MCGIVGYDGVENLTLIKYRSVQNRNTSTRIEILDCINVTQPDIVKQINKWGKGMQTLFLPELHVFENFYNNNVASYEPFSGKYDELQVVGLDLTKRRVFQFGEQPHGFSIYKASRGEILKLELAKAKLDEKYESIVIKTFCELGRLYF